MDLGSSISTLTSFGADLRLLGLDAGEISGLALILALLVIGFILVLVLVFANYFGLWIQSFLTGAGVGIGDLIGMTFRKVNARSIVRSRIMAVQAGLDDPAMTGDALEAHYLAGGNVQQVVRAVIAAKKAKTISLTFREAAAIDLAGRDVLESVKTSVYPKVIDCPPRGAVKPSLDAVAKDGIQLKVRARVTVRANLQQLIGGATEETIIARVGEGIVSAIGSAKNHAAVLENPDVISKAVLAKRLDSQTAFEIVSIDIADIDVGANIGARLMADQAEADTQVARARAEGKRASAVAEEKEMEAKIEESRAQLVMAQAAVPEAMSEAFRTGKLHILDYYKLQNVNADTEMRKAIATTGQKRQNDSSIKRGN
ncbi:flotillin-like protein FloA [Roseiconus lacunae]|uniref:Flotillin-like protein FloA n=1 Tax=Roseiconus lacunae TaxID=2605694 RepID=A0ABT7PJB7_9BACT|nr:flotillin-like protein FloA [Roseiconus lacunae]MCD0461767.1 flotillin-like protein FloA [Roseiconus lacunae]MDM4016590.1 flotillin-like protein FloA [Roseiconus lacunae]WRQ49459.1 flotillin-like protein FloA [Stieleria sp. HD01]